MFKTYASLLLNAVSKDQRPGDSALNEEVVIGYHTCHSVCLEAVIKKVHSCISPAHFLMENSYFKLQ